MSKLRKDDPVYYKVEIKKLIKQARENEIDIGITVNNSKDNEPVRVGVLFQAYGDSAEAVVFDKGWRTTRTSKRGMSEIE